MELNKYNCFSEVWGNNNLSFNSEIKNMLNIEDPVNLK